jgi:hypothetical protein
MVSSNKKTYLELMRKDIFMNKKNTSYLHFTIATIWLIAGIIDIMVSINHFRDKTSFGITYICLAIVCISLAISFMSMGIKKRK